MLRYLVISLSAVVLTLHPTVAAANSGKDENPKETCMNLYFGAPGLQKRAISEMAGQRFEIDFVVESSGDNRIVRGIVANNLEILTEGTCTQNGVVLLKDPSGLSYEGTVFPLPPYRVGRKWSYTIKPVNVTLNCEITKIGAYSVGMKRYDDAVFVSCNAPAVRADGVFVPNVGKAFEENYQAGRKLISFSIIDAKLPAAVGDRRESPRAAATPFVGERRESPRATATPSGARRSDRAPSTPASTPSSSVPAPTAGDLPIPRKAEQVERRNNDIRFVLPGGIRAQYIFVTSKPNAVLPPEDVVGVYIKTLEEDFVAKGWVKSTSSRNASVYQDGRRWLAMQGIPFSKSRSGTVGVVVLVLGENRTAVLEALEEITSGF